MTDRRQRGLVGFERGRRLEGRQVECLQNRGSAERLAGLGPRKD